MRIIILTIIYFVVVVLIKENGCGLGNYIKELWRKGLTIAIQFLLGIGCGSAFFIPGIIGYLNSSRTERENIFENI